MVASVVPVVLEVPRSKRWIRGVCRVKRKRVWMWTICEPFLVLCEGLRVLLFIGVLLVKQMAVLL